MGNNKIKSNIIGLDMGLAIGKFFLDSEDLHFGYWPNNETPSVKNFSWAQNNHSDLILNNIPKNTKTILDVGCGSGNLALKLLNAGYDVDGVIPSKYLAKAVKEKLNGTGEVFISKFENVKLKKKYDLIIFSESFQYVNMELALKKINDSLAAGGYLLICDFFKLNINEKSLMGGGHRWTSFQHIIKLSELIKTNEIDITHETAPTIDFLNNFCQEVLRPMGEMTSQFLLSNYPLITKIIKWKYKNKINKIKKRYLSGDVNGESFKKFKTYKLLVYKK